MIYGVKTLLMKKIISSKQKKKPFDYESGENFKITAEHDETINNSYYFSAHDYSTGESLYCRLGERTVHSEVWFCYVNQENVFTLNKNLFKENIPLKVNKKEGKWIIEYIGEATDSNGNNVQIEFKGEFNSEEQPVDFFSHMPPVRTAKAMAGEKWNKDFFAEVQKNNQVHYEQTGVLIGTIKIGDIEKQINLPCVRDHSFGKRDWNYMNNHLWVMAVNQSSQLNFSMVSYPAMSILECGNFKPENKPMAYVLNAEYDRNQINKGTTPNTLKINLTLNNKSKITVTANILNGFDYYFQNGAYKLIENIAEFDIDGVKYRGVFEIGFNKDESRIFNGREVKRLKV